MLPLSVVIFFLIAMYLLHILYVYSFYLTSVYNLAIGFTLLPFILLSVCPLELNFETLVRN
jgi:hypothetical protein